MNIDLDQKSVFIFDKDDTITDTKTAITAEMSRLLESLSADNYIVIISGSAWYIFEDQILQYLSPENTNLSKWFFLPASGSQMFNFQNGKYNQLYDHSIDQQNFETIKKLLLDSFTRLNDSEKPKKVYSGQIENRVGQITLSALGQQAPRNEKVAWDPTRDKRQKMALWLRPQLPKFDVKVGGSTSIDITKKGINKEFGVRNVLEYLKKDSDNAVYFGDSLEPGGNDEVVKNIAGLDTVAVRSHHETEKILREHLN